MRRTYTFRSRLAGFNPGRLTSATNAERPDSWRPECAARTNAAKSRSHRKEATMEHPRPDAADGSPPAPAPQRQIGILLFDGVEELDAVGPWEVLSTWTQQHPEDGWNAFCFSFDGGPVRSAKTLPLGSHHSID